MWEQQTLLSEDRPASLSPSQGNVKGSPELQDSCSSTFERYVNSVRVGLSGRTSQERSQANVGGAYRQLLSEMDALGYGLAWRVLDAQFFGVAQRRERVFLVGSLGTMRCAEVLFERESLCWDHQSSREKRKSLAGGTAGGVGNADSGIGDLTRGENQSRRVHLSDGIAPALQARENGGQDQSAVMLDFHQQDGRFKVSEHPDLSNTLTSHMGTGGNNVPLVKAFKWNQGERSRSLAIGDVSPTLSTDHNPAVYEVAGNIIGRGQMSGGNQLGVADPDENGAFTLTSHAKKDPPLIYPAEDSTGEDEPVTLQIRGGKPGGGKGALIQHDMSATLSTHNTQTLITGDLEKRDLTVRRLTPRECERLQGFPDDYTDIPYRNKEHAPDGARYKALGNSMAVPVMRWIGQRIQETEGDNE